MPFIDGVGNALKTTLNGGETSGSSTITLDANVFSGISTDHNIVIWNPIHGDPADADAQGEMEIVRRDASEDASPVITVTRAQEGTSAIALGDGWVALLAPTAKMFTDIETEVDGKANTGHTHDDRYYTETEIDDLIDEDWTSKTGNFTVSTSEELNYANTSVNNITATLITGLNEIYVFRQAGAGTITLDDNAGAVTLLGDTATSAQHDRIILQPTETANTYYCKLVPAS